MDIRTKTVTAIALFLSTGVNASTVVINEFLPNAIGTDSGNEWVELYNYSASPVDLSGWKLQKATSSYSTFYTFSTGTILSAGEFFVLGGANITEADFNINSLGLGNAGASGDAIRLLNEVENTIDIVIYGDNNNDGFIDDSGLIALDLVNKPSAGFSLGRIFDGMDTGVSGSDFIAFETPTTGTSNNITSVPIASTMWLFGSGLIGITGLTWRRSPSIA